MKFHLSFIAFLCAILLSGTFVAAQESLDVAVAAAITHFNEQPNALTAYREVERVQEGNGAIIFVEVFDNESGDAYPGVIDWLYAHRVQNTWTITAPSDANYRAAALQLSDDLLVEAEAADQRHRTQAQPDLVSTESLLDYELPFPTGAFGVITRSFDQHGIGRIDFDLTAREIAAVKDGVIVFASDLYTLQTFQSGAWWYWNTVIIQHGDYEFSLYGHLAQNSIPAWIKAACNIYAGATCAVPIQAGEIIGLEGNTGNSTNPHLHLELGQGFDVISYPDVLDGDGDGIRDEPVYAGYVYAEHNVGLNGVLPEAAAAWEYLTVLQAETE